MESYAVNEKEREIDIKQLLLYILDNIKWVILAGLLFGILLGAYGYMKASKSDSPEASSASIQDIIKKNRTRWNALDTSVTSDSFSDPLPGTYISNAKIYVDFDYSNIEGNTNLDFTAMNGKIQGDIVALAGSNESRQEVIDSLNLHSYDDMANFSLEDLKYMTGCSFVGANILQIQVADSDGDRAIAIADSLANNLINNVAQYETVDDIRLLENARIVYSPVYEDIGTTGYIKSIVKYGVTGIFLGLVLVCGICFLNYLLKDTVRTKEDIRRLGLNEFGMIPIEDKQKNIELRRLAYNIKFLEKKEIAILPVDIFTKVDDFEPVISKLLKGKDCNVKTLENIMENPEAINSIQKFDSVILVATYGKTLMKNLEMVKYEIEKSKKLIAGVVLLDVKH